MEYAEERDRTYSSVCVRSEGFRFSFITRFQRRVNSIWFGVRITLCVLKSTSEKISGYCVSTHRPSPSSTNGFLISSAYRMRPFSVWIIEGLRPAPGPITIESSRGNSFFTLSMFSTASSFTRLSESLFETHPAEHYISFDKVITGYTINSGL